MSELTKEQVCDKIAELKAELSAYQNLLDKFNEQAKNEFSIKIKSMVGKCFMKNLWGTKLYYRIDSVNRIEDSNVDDLYAKCQCCFISIYKNTYSKYRLESIYIYDDDLEDCKPITNEEFDAVVAKFDNKFDK